MSAADFIKKYTANFNADAAAGLDLTFQFDIEDSGSYQLIVRNSSCQIVEGAAEDPDVTLITDTDTLKEIAAGELSGMSAFMSGRLRTEGNIMLAMKLGDLFPG